jgi:DNA polymerase-3 subunit delta
MIKKRYDQQFELNKQINIIGTEKLLISRTKKYIRSLFERKNKSADIINIDLLTKTQENISEMLSKSLFANNKLVFFDNFNKISNDFINSYNSLKNNFSADDVFVFIGNPSKLAKSILSPDTLIIDCPEIKWANEKMFFAKNEFIKKNKSIDNVALQELVNANLDSLENLASTINQIINDNTEISNFTKDIIALYTENRIETTIFELLDDVLARNKENAIKKLKYSLEIGVSTMQILGILANGLRTMGKVGAADYLKLDMAKDLKITTWQAKKMTKFLKNWNSKTLSNAIQMVANVDFSIKNGKIKNQKYSLQKLILEI